MHHFSYSTNEEYEETPGKSGGPGVMWSMQLNINNEEVSVAAKLCYSEMKSFFKEGIHICKAIMTN